MKKMGMNKMLDVSVIGCAFRWAAAGRVCFDYVVDVLDKVERERCVWYEA